MAYSRILRAQVDWTKPTHGVSGIMLANVHFHHLAAKKAWSWQTRGMLRILRSNDMKGMSHGTCT